jgi:hypothetical protein
MTNRKESVAELRQKLPYGSFKRIKVRLLDKGIKFSVQYISRVLHPDKSDYNRAIIEEAIMIAKENAIQMDELRKLMEQLKTTQS